MPVFPSLMKEIRNGSYTLSSCTPLLQIIAIFPSLLSCFGHQCSDQLTAVKTGYLLTSIT